MMGLLQKALETYDCHQKYVGVYRTGHAVLAPVSHILTAAALEITLNDKGEFLGAAALAKEEPKIILPATEESAGRTSGIAAHPLSEQLGYLAPYNKEKHENYLSQLRKWTSSRNSHPKLLPILTYVERGDILSDLARCGLVKLSDQGMLEEAKDEKKLVRWRVVLPHDDFSSACWEDISLFDAFIGFYREEGSEKNAGLCMISGEYGRRAEQHPKGVVPIHGNAKLISSNDDKGFTYRGRFANENEAAYIGYEASQKAHNALRWLVSEQGARNLFGGRTFLCWNPQGQEVCHAAGVFARFEEPVIEPTDYRKALKRTLDGYRTRLPKEADVVIAAFDAATSGRLALTYYSEWKASDFLERLYDWDRICCWPNGSWGIQSPSLEQIVDCAFGTQQEKRLKTDNRVMRQQIQRLIACRLNRAAMPADIVRALFQRASLPLAYEENIRKKLLTTACAVIRKYRFDRYKEEWEMSLEEKKEDRSYQFGRLLAVLEKAERDTYDDDEKREPNAIRLQSLFCRRPMATAANIEEGLERAYFPRLKPGSRMFYKKLIGEILEEINRFPQEEWNRPLGETYLMGYYLQRQALYTKKGGGDSTREDDMSGDVSDTDPDFPDTDE